MRFKMKSVLLVFVLLILVSTGVIATDGELSVYFSPNAQENEQLEEAFNQVYPGIDLKFITVSGTVLENLDKLTVMMLGGQDLDVVTMTNDDIYDRLANMEVLEPLNDYVSNDDQVDLSSVQGMMEKAYRDGKYYGLPYRNSVWITYYNKNIFDKAGVPYPERDWTWQDFKQIAKKLTKGEGRDKIYGAVMPDWAQTWAAHATQAGVPYYTEDGKINIDHPEFLKHLKMRYEMTMVDKSMPSVMENKINKTHYSKYFSSGNFGMLTVGEWTIGQIRNNLEGNYTFEYDIQVLPHPEGTKPTTWGTTCWAGMSRNSRNKDAAFKLIKFLSGPEGAKLMASQAKMPAIISEEAKAIFKENIPDFVTNADILFLDYEYCMEKPIGPGSAIYQSILQEESDLALMDQKTLEKALKDAKARITKEIEAQ